MKKLHKEVFNQLAVEFPEITRRQMKCIIFHLFDAKGASESLEATRDELIRENKRTIYDQKKRDDILYTLSLEVGRSICKDKSYVEKLERVIVRAVNKVLVEPRSKEFYSEATEKILPPTKHQALQPR